METITIDGMDEDAFRHSIEDMLRHDQIDQAVARLRGLLEPYAGEGGILPSRFLDVSSADVEFGGWQKLADRLLNHDRPSHAISAIGVTLADARALGGPGPRDGRMAPFIKTFYFSDEAYPFSIATREDLLDGYTRDGFEWEADYQATDATLSIQGLDDLHGAIVELEDRLLASPAPGEDEIRAGTIGACYLAALIHQSLRRTVREQGLPRPMCVLAACDGVYPFFDAPVAGSDEAIVPPAGATMADGAAPAMDDSFAQMEAEAADEEAPAEASLLDMVSRKGKKTPVLVLAEADVREATHLTEMAGAEQLGANATILHDLMASFAPDAPVDEPMPDEGQSWGDFEAADQRAGPVVPPPVGIEPVDHDAGWVPVAEVRLPPDALDEPSPDAPPPAYVPADEFEQVAEADAPDPAAGDEEGHDAPTDSPVVEPEPAEVSFAEPARHSLRARTRMAQVDESRTLMQRFLAFVDWLGRLALRR